MLRAIRSGSKGTASTAFRRHKKTRKNPFSVSFWPKNPISGNPTKIFIDDDFVALEIPYEHLRNGFPDFSIVWTLQPVKDGVPFFGGGLSVPPFREISKLPIYRWEMLRTLVADLLPLSDCQNSNFKYFLRFFESQKRAKNDVFCKPPSLTSLKMRISKNR